MKIFFNPSRHSISLESGEILLEDCAFEQIELINAFTYCYQGCIASESDARIFLQDWLMMSDPDSDPVDFQHRNIQACTKLLLFPQSQPMGLLEKVSEENLYNEKAQSIFASLLRTLTALQQDGVFVANPLICFN